MQPTRELRLFISSTFRDLIEEREELLKRIFPLIRHACRQRGVDFVEIDLRWGLTELDARLGNIVRTCIEEIDRCRPFFLGILGSRYGWSPSFVEIQKDPDLLRRFPWIEDAAVEGASILELEFSHAILNRPPAIGTFVYRRDDEWVGDDGARLRRLSERVEESGVPIRTFDSVDALGRLVLEDLMRAINHYWPESPTDSFLERERREQAAFAVTRRKAYIANADALRELSSHITTSSKPLVITAPSGQGKSALVAYWSEFIKRKQPDALVLTHFVGLSTAGSGAHAILRHFLEELRASLGDDVGEEAQAAVAAAATPAAESIESEFRIWLARVTDRPVVLIVDAVNQLDERWHTMEWLPETERDNVHWIISTTGGETERALEGRGWDVYRLDQLNVKEREALIVRFLGDFRKSLNADQLERIATAQNSASPLFLRTLLEELRLFGNFEGLDQVIDDYLSVPDIAGLFQKVLVRMQEDFGAVRVRELLTLIWGARKGLAEAELIELTGISKPRLTKFLLSLEYQLLPRGGFVTLFHDYLAEAIERAYLPSDEHKKKLHERLARYFDEKELNERNAYELLWQWAQAGRLDRIRTLLVSPLHFRFFMTDEHKWEYLRYWRLIDSDRELALELADRLRRAAEQSYSHEEERLEQVAVGASFLHEIGQAQLALELAEFTEAKLTELPEAFKSLRIQLLGIKGQAYQSLSEYQKAEDAFNQQIREAEEVGSCDLPSALDNLGSLEYTLGKYDAAEAHFAAAERALRPAASARQRISIIQNIASAQYALQKPAMAEQTIERGLALADTILAPDLESNLLNSLGAIYMSQHRYEEAEECVVKSLKKLSTLYGPRHEKILLRKGNHAWLLFLKDEPAAARAILEDLIQVSGDVFGVDSPRFGVLMLNLAEICTDLRDFNAAADYGIRARIALHSCAMEGTVQYALALLSEVPALLERGEEQKAKEIAGRTIERARSARGRSRIVSTIESLLPDINPVVEAAVL